MSSDSSNPTPAPAAESGFASFFGSVKKGLAVAADVTKKAAISAAEKTKQTYEEMKAPPSSIQCSGCPLQVQVPATIWDWHCENAHTNSRDKSVCDFCKAPRSKSLPEPSVTCSACKSFTDVPSSNAGKHLKEAAASTKKFVSNAAAATKDQYNYLKATPETFHCAHCNSLLAVPTGPWACQTCTAENEESAKQCRQCTQKKTEQKAICGVCRNSTQIPTTNLADGFKSFTSDISQSSKKIYLDVAGKPYVTCPRCSAHVKLPEKIVPAVESRVGAGEKTTAEEGKQSSTTATEGAEGKVHQSVLCSSCKNPVEY